MISTQATHIPPPAVALPDQGRIRFLASIVGNALGFLAVMAFSAGALLLMQSVLPVSSGAL